VKIIPFKLHTTFFWSIIGLFEAFFLPLASSAQQFQFEKFGVEKGLSNNFVNTILQDRRGFIWAGTSNGLNRFDGYNFTVYKNEQGNLSSLSDNQINALHEDRQSGHIWVGTQNGICVFDPRTEHSSSDSGTIQLIPTVLPLTVFTAFGRTQMVISGLAQTQNWKNMNGKQVILSIMMRPLSEKI
jgi:hypothetical protein